MESRGEGEMRKNRRRWSHRWREEGMRETRRGIERTVRDRHSIRSLNARY